jgi:hypothetical protein
VIPGGKHGQNLISIKLDLKRIVSSELEMGMHKERAVCIRFVFTIHKLRPNKKLNSVIV